MSLFDGLVTQALANAPDLAPLRPVVEKEVLHREILRVMNDSGDLSQLTFMGGTCLRCCYGSPRLSEDLDFTAGPDFDKAMLVSLGETLVEQLQEKYAFAVQVSPPVREEGNTDTWKVKIQTRPKRPDLPAQRINIDVCSVRSYQVRPMVLLNPYGVDLGVSGLIIRAESREEIFVDKLVALALRPNRVKHRDLWDIAWLHEQAVKPAGELLFEKAREHGFKPGAFLEKLDIRIAVLKDQELMLREFRAEMLRFLPAAISSRTVGNPMFWPALIHLIEDIRAGFKSL
jgi:predicted nucleotidyltransferase component of viral defense system